MTNKSAFNSRITYGQYSHTDDFGLHFYNARWYDSALGRFTQADTVTPGGVQGLDRYAGMANNPVRFNDPTGHRPSEDNPPPKPNPNPPVKTPPPPNPTPEPDTGQPQTTDEEMIESPAIVCSTPMRGESCDWKTPVNPPFTFDPSKVDWVDVGIDIIGITGDIAQAFPPYGTIYWGITELVEIAGMAKDFDDLEMGDPSGMLITLGNTAADVGKLIPNSGSWFNLIDILYNLGQGIEYQAP